MKLEQRKDSRIVLSVPVHYKVFNLDNLVMDVQDQALNLKAAIQDLSLGGIQVVSDQAFQPGAVLELEIPILGDKLVRTVAKVIWCRPAPKPNNAEYNSGIQFIPMYEEDLLKLNQYLKKEI
jgi:hypothetical protein